MLSEVNKVDKDNHIFVSFHLYFVPPPLILTPPFINFSKSLKPPPFIMNMRVWRIQNFKTVWEVQNYKTLYGRYRIIRLCMGGTELKDFVWEVQNYKTLYGRYRIERLCMGGTEL